MGTGKLRQPLIVLAGLSVMSCALSQLFTSSNPAFEQTSTAIVATNQWLTTQIAATETQVALVTVTPSAVAPCYFNWANQDLPDLTAEIQAAMDAVGLENVTASASAYGENCYAYDTNEVQYFAAMETDFYVTAQVENLGDETAVGDLAAQIITVLIQFPPDDTPGAMPGRITITFTQGAKQQMLQVGVEQARAAVERGLAGAALLEALELQPSGRYRRFASTIPSQDNSMDYSGN